MGGPPQMSEFNDAIDRLVKLIDQLSVPSEELWRRVPGVDQKDIEEWKDGLGEGEDE